MKRIRSSTSPAARGICTTSSRTFSRRRRSRSGPMLLRDWDIGREMMRTRGSTSSRRFARLCDTYPCAAIHSRRRQRPGRSGDLRRAGDANFRDASSRSTSATCRRIPSAWRRSARSPIEVTAAGSTLLLADDTLAAARHAAAHGWIDEAALAEIGSEKRADEGTTGGKVETPGVEPDLLRRSSSIPTSRRATSSRRCIGSASSESEHHSPSRFS